MPRHFFNFAHNVLFWALLLIAVSFLGINLLFSGIENYKADLANKLSEFIEAPVKIGKLNASLHGIKPELHLSKLNIAEGKIQLKEIRLGVDIGQLFSTQNILTATTVTLVGAQITLIRHTDNSISVEGLKASQGQPVWLLQGKYLLLQSSITWRDEKWHTPSKQISSVNLAIINVSENHRVNLLVQLQQTESLRISANFTGNPFQPQTVSGKIFFEGNNLKFNEFSEFNFSSFPLKITDGFFSLKANADWQNGDLSHVNGKAKLWDVTFTQPQHSNLKLKEVVSHFQLEHQNTTWHINLPKVEISTSETELNGAITATIDENNLNENSLGVFFTKLEMTPLAPALNFFTDYSFDSNQLTGTLTNFYLFTQPKQKKWTVNSNFNEVAVHNANLQIEHLDGHVQGNESAGIIQLNSEKIAFNASSFREPLPLKKLNAMLNWKKTMQMWQIESEKIILNSKDISSESCLKLMLPENGRVFMDLQTQFEIYDASQVLHYLPVNIMKKEVVEWVDKAFESGRVKNGQFLFYGDLKNFPFEKKEGVFEVLFNAENVKLNYAPQWLALEYVTAQVRFYQDSLQVNLSGTAKEVTIKAAEVTIPSLFTSDYIHVVTEAEGNITQVLDFMQSTPLKSRTVPILATILPQGKTNISLDLLISMTDNINSKVKGAAQFQNAKLKIKSFDLPVYAINGTLQFTENTLFSKKISAIALNKPIEISLQSNAIQTDVHVIGNTSIKDLFEQLKILSPLSLNSTTPWIEGGTDYDLLLTLPYEKTAPTLRLKSMLSGVTLNLPSEFIKQKLQKIPLAMTFTLGDDDWLPFTLNYNDRLKAVVNIDIKNQNIERGVILLGAGQIAMPEIQGLSFKISQENLILQDWLGFALAHSENKTNDIHTLSIYSQHAHWKKIDLGEFDLILKHDIHDNSWQGKLNNSFAQGLLQFSTDSVLKLKLEKLDLAILNTGQSSEELGNPNLNNGSELIKQWPSLSLESERTFWRGKPLGKLTIEAQHTDKGITFKNIDLQAETHHLSLIGDSILQTQLHGKLEFFNAGQLLNTLGITKDIAETSGTAKLDLLWQGTPQQFSLKKLHGELGLNLQTGRILSIEPGFGRVLGMLAFEQWLKRIQLDFSDVYAEGLTFNSIRGQFNIGQGKAYTQDLTVDAIPAKIILKGEVDFLNENVDYLANVTPKSADAVPIAGTIASNIMNIVGKTLTGKDTDGFFFGSQYEVKGSWRDINVISIHENDGLIQKTWHGITDFPWIPVFQKSNSKEVQYD